MGHANNSVEGLWVPTVLVPPIIKTLPNGDLDDDAMQNDPAAQGRIEWGRLDEDGSTKIPVGDAEQLMTEVTEFVRRSLPYVITDKVAGHIGYGVSELAQNMFRYGHRGGLEDVPLDSLLLRVNLSSIAASEGVSHRISLMAFDCGPDLPATPDELADQAMEPERLEFTHRRGFLMMRAYCSFRIFSHRLNEHQKVIALIRIIGPDAV